ncbi:MAG TPA: hypothetical protein VF116_18020 [Ktedonobacterales bacterium]
MNSTAGTASVRDFEVANIVPLRDTRVVGTRLVPVEAAPALAPAQLSYRGGPLIASAKVYALYWGSTWASTLPPSSGPQGVTRAAFDGFLSDVVRSAYMVLLAEYSTENVTIGRGSLLGSNIVGADPASQVSDSDIRAQLTSRMADGTLPPWDVSTLYAVLLPPGTTVTISGGAASCSDFCGYHDAILDANGNPLAYYAVLPYPGCQGCMQAQNGTLLSDFDALTTVASHEIAEAVTDPIPGRGWYDDQQGEIGDICAWQLAALDGYAVQQLWSNRQQACVGPAGG